MPNVVIDGYCAPSDAVRFCLGALPNPQRGQDIELVRRQIGTVTVSYRILFDGMMFRGGVGSS